jgi:hypothetical protein
LSVRGRVAVIALLVLVSRIAPASAQAPRIIRPAEAVGFLTDFDYHFSLEAIGTDDPQFSWVSHFGGDFDIAGGPRGRANAAFDYEAVLGDEFQPFDPNQGNYGIELLGGGRFGRFEPALVFHHTSRHLGDRAKDFGIAWNVLGPQLAWTRDEAGEVLQVRARALKTVMTDFVDYSAEFSVDLLYRRRVTRLTSVVARAEALARTVDSDVSGRGTQSGGRLEGALRIAGRAAGLEVFAGVERRIDASALVGRPMTWALVGLRIQNVD